MRKVIIPVPSVDFDPSEAAISWAYLASHGVQCSFATPDGKPAQGDSRMLRGHGLGPWAPILRADRRARAAYEKMVGSSEFKNPISWDSIEENEFDGLLLPGGHAPGMKEYLESRQLQSVVASFFSAQKPVGAICHGVVLAARSQREGKSVLFGYKTTSLLKTQELTAWAMTCLWLGSYYRTYPQTVEAEVKGVLARESDFEKGPTPFLRDDPQNLQRGFVVRDRNYLSARWPGDAHRFASEFLKML